MQIKVLMGTCYPYDEKKVRGGVEAVALNLVQALGKREDIELHVASFTPLVKRAQTEKRDRVVFHWFTTIKPLYGLRAMTIDGWRFRWLCKCLRPDVIHAQNVSEYATRIPPGIPLVLTIHGVELFEPVMWKTRHFQGVVGAYRKWIGKEIFRLSIQNANAVISIAGEYIPNLMKGLLNGKLIENIPNPIGDFWFYSTLERKGDSEVSILCVGDIIERKNALGLVLAFSKVKSRFPYAKLWFAGGIQDPIYYKKVVNEIYLLNLKENIEFLGRLDDVELRKRYTKASLVVLPSIQETLPMSLAQAMAMGKPVVATQVGGVPWIIQNGVNGFCVPPNDLDALAEGIIQLLGNSKLRTQMGNQGQKLARALFYAERVAEKTVKLYRKVLKS